VVRKSGTGEPYCDTDEASSYSRIHFDGDQFIVPDPEKTHHPVVQLSWYGAVAYCNWLSAGENLDPAYDLETWACDWDASGYRLPTEAEYEYAERGGEHDPYLSYPWGNEIDGSMANYRESGDPFESEPWPKTSPVGYFDGNQSPPGDDMANGYGLYDIAGNVRELCHDWWDEDYYASLPYVNPRGPESGTHRVARGGGWLDWAHELRTAYRDRYLPDWRGPYLGFRVARRAP
jgi:formylglycine-generating enzyme required for sulfatase activity